jgi:hypothetical protein
VKSVCTSLSAISVVVALIGSASVSAFVAGIHPLCTAKQHDCGTGPLIQACCCADQSGTTDQTAPNAKVTFNVTLLPVAAVAAHLFVPVSTHASMPTVVPPPRSSPVDLPTLFASLLI